MVLPSRGVPTFGVPPMGGLPGEVLPSGGCVLPSGGVLPSKVEGEQAGGIPACTEADHPPL